jgi:hypothetical protein
VALGLLALVGVAGCGAAAASRGTPDPRGTLRAWAVAVRARDAGAAYALLDADARQGTDRARFSALFTAHHAELAAQATALEAGAASDIGARARLTLVGGEVVALVLEDGAWRIDGGVLDAPGLRTPEDAVASLRRALARRSLDGVLRVLSRETRGEVEAEIARFLAASEDTADLETRVEGDAAEVRLGGGARVTLVREAGAWRVADVE